MADQEPMTDVAEPDLFPELRDALVLLRDQIDDDEFRTVVDDVLGGRMSITEAATVPAFGTVLIGLLGGSVEEGCGGHPEGEACAADDAADPASRCAGCAGLCALRDAAPQ